MFEKELQENTFSFVFIRKEAGYSFNDEIKNLVSDKKFFFFSGVDFGRQKNIDRLWNELIFFFENRQIAGKNINLEGVLEYIVSMASKEKIVWIFDNIEELISFEDFECVDNVLKSLKNTNNTVVFLSDSAVFSNKFKESKLNTYSSESLFKKEKGYFSINEMSRLTVEDRFRYYSVFGDRTDYLKKLDFSRSFKENIIDTFFNVSGIFFSEPNRILKKELREVQIYNLILEAVSKDASTLNDISEFVGLPTSICNKYTTVLLSLGIIKKIKPVLEQDTRRSKYKLTNNLMSFWYYFIPQNISEIAADKGEWVFDNRIYNNMYKYYQMKFPDLCSEFISKLNREGKTGIDIKEIGTWWNKKDSIDIVAGNGLEVIAADCFWNDKLVEKEALESLEIKAKSLDVIDKKYYLFSRKGFSDELKRFVLERKDVSLVSFESMIDTETKSEKPKRKSFFFSRR